MHFAANLGKEGDDMHHVLVVEDVNVGPLLEEKAINVDDCRLSSTRRINKVKTCADLPVKKAPQLNGP
jgi:hypothetical protein